MGQSEIHFVPGKRLVIIRRFGEIGVDELLRGVGRMFEGRDTKIAIVVTRELDYGKARMFEQLSELPLVTVFQSLEEAYEWFEIEMDYADCPSWERT